MTGVAGMYALLAFFLANVNVNHHRYQMSYCAIDNRSSGVSVVSGGRLMLSCAGAANEISKPARPLAK